MGRPQPHSENPLDDYLLAVLSRFPQGLTFDDLVGWTVTYREFVQWSLGRLTKAGRVDARFERSRGRLIWRLAEAQEAVA